MLRITTACEEFILAATRKLSGKAYGVAVHRSLQGAGCDFAVSQIYSVLGRLERDGLVKSSVGPAEAVRGGRRKTFFTITPEGLSALQELESVRFSIAASEPS